MLATIKEIKEYFDYPTTGAFLKDWKELSPDEQKWLKEEVGKILGK